MSDNSLVSTRSLVCRKQQNLIQRRKEIKYSLSAGSETGLAILFITQQVRTYRDREEHGEIGYTLSERERRKLSRIR